MILSDREIIVQAKGGMIRPFTSESVRQSDRTAIISYGLSGYGYDLRLSPKDFKIFRHIPGTVVDPKAFNAANLDPAQLHEDSHGCYFILPARSYGLGVAVEELHMPLDLLGLCVGKSTYARCGIIANLTPVEPGWCGNLTLEFSNSSAADCRIYANEGVVQILFLRGLPCAISYAARQGKYQGQSEAITLPKM